MTPSFQAIFVEYAVVALSRLIPAIGLFTCIWQIIEFIKNTFVIMIKPDNQAKKRHNAIAGNIFVDSFKDIIFKF